MRRDSLTRFSALVFHQKLLFLVPISDIFWLIWIHTPGTWCWIRVAPRKFFMHKYLSGKLPMGPDEVFWWQSHEIVPLAAAKHPLIARKQLCKWPKCKLLSEWNSRSTPSKLRKQLVITRSSKSWCQQKKALLNRCNCWHQKILNISSPCIALLSWLGWN